MQSIKKSILSRAQFWSTCLGNLFEHYDTALFGFLSPFLAPLIFPNQDPLTALILTYGMIPLGMLARPLGSLVFGYIGDVRGRRQALFLTLGGMGLVSGAIALSPLYAQTGIFSPLIFCAGRLAMNFLSAGESMGGAIYLLENTPEKRHDWLSSLYNASTIAGILCASGGVALLCYFEGVENGWRFLYALGSITALFGCWIRRQASQDDAPLEKSSLRTLVPMFWQYRKALGFIAITAGFGYANYSMALVLMNGFVPLVTSLTKVQMTALNTGLLVLDFCTLPLFGWLASKISREKIMTGAALGVFLSAIPLFLFLEGATLFSVVAVRICLVLLGVAFFAPFHAWAQQLIPHNHRYMILSFGYAIGSQLLGGPTAAVSLWLYQKTGMVSSVCWYWMALALATTLTLAKTSRVKNTLKVFRWRQTT